RTPAGHCTWLRVFSPALPILIYSLDHREDLPMKNAVRCALLVVACTVSTFASVTVVKPEDVGLSSVRLQRITDMIQRHIAAGDLTGAVTVVARRGKVAHLVPQGVMNLDTKQPMTPASMFR